MKNKKIIGVFILVVLIVILGGIQYHNSLKAKEINQQRVENWSKDIDHLTRNLSEIQRDLYPGLTSTELQKKMAQLKKDIPNLDDDEIQIKMKEILALRKDAHLLNLDFESNLQKIFGYKTFINIYMPQTLKKILPVKTYWFQDSLYVTEIDSKYKECLGSRLVKINDTDIKEVISKIDTLISHNNKWRLKFMDPMYLVHPKVLKYFGLMDKEKVKFTFLKEDGQKLDVNIAEEEIDKVNFQSGFIDINKKPLYLKKNDAFWHEYFSDKKILYFKFNLYADKTNNCESFFSKSPDTKVELPSLDEHLQELASIIEKNDVDKFILDLRDNNGGSMGIGNTLLDFIKNNPKINKKGKLFVIANRGSFSMPVLDCLRYKEETEAITFGEPTGETPFMQGSGGASTLTLPSSGLSIFYSENVFKPADKNIDTYTPDYLVDTTFEDYKNGVDAVFDAIDKYK